MINPGGIPQVTGDLGAVRAQGQTLRSTGVEITDTGADVHAAWQGLAGVYEAPEADVLLAAMVPVRAGAASVGEKVSGVGAALIGYADEVEPIQAELRSLQGRAQGFLTSIAGDDDWNSDGDKVDEHNQLLSAVSAAVAAWMDAQRRCANDITALVGGTQFVPDNGDGQQAANEFGYTPEQLAGAAASEQGLPWGRTAERDKPWWEDGWDGAYGFVWEGLVVDAIWGGLQDLGSLVGTQGWEQMKTSWAGLGTFAVALTPVSTLNHYTDVGPWKQGELGDTLTATGKAMVAWDTWDDDPARAAGATTGNIFVAVLGTKGAGGAVKGAAAGVVATRAPRVSAVAAQISARAPSVRLPTVPSLRRIDLSDDAGSITATTSPDGLLLTGNQDSLEGARIRPRDSAAAVLEWAPRVYDEIRAADDVDGIAGKLNWAPERVRVAKEHLFLNEHRLDDRIGRFDENPDIAEAWLRLQQGQALPEDIILIRHEEFEARYEEAHPGATYREAHAATREAGFVWDPPPPGSQREK